MATRRRMRRMRTWVNWIKRVHRSVRGLEPRLRLLHMIYASRGHRHARAVAKSSDFGV